jgi:transcriptional regulator with XRE-family HTH domain
MSAPESRRVEEVFSSRLRSLREARGFTQEALAEAVGLQPAMLSHIERGRRGPSLATLVKLSEVLAVSTDYLLGLDTQPVPAGKVASRLVGLLPSLSSRDMSVVLKLVEEMVRSGGAE